MKNIINILLVLTLTSYAAFSQNQYKEISLAGLLAKMKKGDTANMVVLDVRSPGEYADTLASLQGNIGKIKGAVNMDLQRLSSDSQAIHELDGIRQKDIYVICSHSFRSRGACNILQRNGFSRVTNVKGGMSDWFRQQPELAVYQPLFYETKATFKNLSPAELFMLYKSGKDFLLLGCIKKPESSMDSMTSNYYYYFPDLKNIKIYKYEDSLSVLEMTRKAKMPVVVLNIGNTRGAETVNWLSGKGIRDVSFLIGGMTDFITYLQAYEPAYKDTYLIQKNTVAFVTPFTLCNETSQVTIVDTRPDSIYNKISNGTKLKYKHIKGSINFFRGKGEDEFQKLFPDKSKTYVLVTQGGSLTPDILFAVALAEKGYHIQFLIGGLQMWEWNINNRDNFNCQESFE